ncbi:hypothetical protein V9T40_012377 [Parthenolecanium corni]|uniref:Uncharacterized protein n=1 Tax=Parthenolecanium corni TaxID=536013 RepID=A0AAN9XZ19_9HEMI
MSLDVNVTPGMVNVHRNWKNAIEIIFFIRTVDLVIIYDILILVKPANSLDNNSFQEYPPRRSDPGYCLYSDPFGAKLREKKCPFIAPADGKCAPKLRECDPDYIFYTDDGSCNNLRYSNFGQAMYPFERWLPADYSDGYDQPRVSVLGNPLPNSRKLRTSLLPNNEFRDSEINALFYAFGKYSSHDPSEHRPLLAELSAVLKNQGNSVKEDGRILPQKTKTIAQALMTK